jgi:hypothetical protein
MKKLLGLLLVCSLFCSAQEQRMTGSFLFTRTVSYNHASAAITSTGTTTLTTDNLRAGLIVAPTATATSTFILPTATQIVNDLELDAGSVIEFYVLNNTGTNGTITVQVGSGITASGFPSSNTLTLAGSATVGIAGFRLTFLSTTAATLTRIN